MLFHHRQNQPGGVRRGMVHAVPGDSPRGFVVVATAGVEIAVEPRKVRARDFRRSRQHRQAVREDEAADRNSVALYEGVELDRLLEVGVDAGAE